MSLRVGLKTLLLFQEMQNVDVPLVRSFRLLSELFFEQMKAPHWHIKRKTGAGISKERGILWESRRSPQVSETSPEKERCLARSVDR